jgi:hypothetical protein
MVDCWHDCTPCAAAEQRLDIAMIDSEGQSVPGDKPEQVFLSEDALRHLVIWRPDRAPNPGDYEIRVGVRGQSDVSTHALSVTDALAPPAADDVVSAMVSSYRVEHGTIYTCDRSQTDCDHSTLVFGSSYEMLPALDVRVGIPADPTVTGQLLFRLMHNSADAATHWGSWKAASDAGGEIARFAEAGAEYCADLEVRNLLENADAARQSLCRPHGDLQAPLSGDTDIASQLGACLRAPPGLEPEWCALHQPECAAGGGSLVTCDEVARLCVDPISRGTAAQGGTFGDGTSIEAAELCASASDPYDEEIAGCTCRVANRRWDGSQLGWFGALALAYWCRRTRRRRTCAETEGR